MNRKMRVVLVLVMLEILLAGGWWMMARFGAENPDRITADFQETVGQTMGAAMGALAGFGVLMFFIAARNDRNARR